MIMCTSARVIFIWIQLVSLCILTNTTPSLTRVKFQSNSHGELSQLTKKKTRRRTVSMANLAKKNLKKKLFSKMATLKMKTIVWTPMTLIMQTSSRKRTREEEKRPSPLSPESIKESERLLKMTQCSSKMRSLQLSHSKERSGQILRLLAVLPLSHKVHITTHAPLSATPLALKKDLL